MGKVIMSGIVPQLVVPRVVDRNTLFLLHGDEVVDSGRDGVYITNNGVVVAAEAGQFGSALFFDGNSNLTFHLTEDCFAGTHDWTVEWWERRLSTKTSSAVFCRPITSSPSSGLILADDNGNRVLTLYESSTGASHDVATGRTIGDFQIGSWCHRAVVKHNGTYMAFQNGYKQASSVFTFTGDIAQSSQALRIGNYGNSMFYGYIDEFRISNIARWTEHFTPPTEPY